MKTQIQKLESELEHRRRNLQVIEEAIRADAGSGQKLASVRDFLLQRIEQIERELNTKKTLVTYN